MTTTLSRAGDTPPPPVPQTNERLLGLLARAGARDVLDIGCGHGALSRLLAANGYRVTGIDPDWTAVETARAKVAGARFEVATAENLPFAEDSFDAAVFLNALHHVPGAAMARALDEALRVLRPGGTLVVVEPLARGSFFEVMRPVEDETAIRAEAMTALEERIAKRDCELRQKVVYDRATTFGTLDDFIAYLVAVDPARREVADARRAELQSLFERHAVKAADGHLLVQPLMLAELGVPPRG
ncbi:MAG: methylase [Stappia sp.]|uniref:class I SAM-dependent methyltransferase n=1 Tax=Stappia sp. TaxID=1870903 RepID=UPI000C48C619|nr:class I SAM-dependent methyltransferase [Stappia sp.]MAA97218.1 methylase [Stappia sp.]MBM19098.1 methylase [Stappia sp.]